MFRCDDEVSVYDFGFQFRYIQLLNMHLFISSIWYCLLFQIWVFWSRKTQTRPDFSSNAEIIFSFYIQITTTTTKNLKNLKFLNLLLLLFFLKNSNLEKRNQSIFNLNFSSILLLFLTLLRLLLLLLSILTVLFDEIINYYYLIANKKKLTIILKEEKENYRFILLLLLLINRERYIITIYIYIYI